MKQTTITFLVLATIALLTARAGYAVVYEVGPGRAYERIIDTPTHDLQPGDSVVVYYKQEPYYEKFLLHGIGTAEQPIVLLGIADSLGNRPILDGTNAITSRQFGFWNEVRQLVLVGLYETLVSDNIIIDGFEIRNANDNHSFTDDRGEQAVYAENACAIRAEHCKNLTIRNCWLHHCMNGFQNGETPDQQNVLLESCWIEQNGAGKDPARYLEHNIYVGGRGVHLTVQYCRFGELLNDGQQLKSRAQTNIIRYNWIEGGHNSQLDLVDGTFGDSIIANAYVYGNVIIKPDSTNNSRFIHFGGDQAGNTRRGTLYFYNNTCIIRSTRNWGTRRLFELSRDSAYVIADNNIFYSPNNEYALYNLRPNISGSNNWLSNEITGDELLTGSLRGDNPGFVSAEEFQFHLTEGSPCRDVVAEYQFPEGFGIDREYGEHLGWIERSHNNGGWDLGAFHFPVVEDNVRDVHSPLPRLEAIADVYPNPFNGQLSVRVRLPLSGTLTIELTDMTGRNCYHREMSFNSGAHSISISPERISASGMYLLTLHLDGELKQRQKVVFVK